MRKLAFVVILCACTLGLTAHLIAAPSGRPVIAVMEFHPAHSDMWTEDNEVDFGKDDQGHFFFKDNEKIDLNILRQDQDLANELNSKGKDELVRQIIHGQNVVNQLFSVGETKVTDTRLERNSEVAILTVHATQDLPDGKYERLEKYFIGVGQTLHAELRWKADVDSKTVKQARNDFESGHFSLAGMKEAAK